MLAALAAFEEAGDRRSACAARSELGRVYARLGDVARAEDTLRAAAVTAERMGLVELAAAARHMLRSLAGA